MPTLGRFIRAIKRFANSEFGGKAKWMFAGLITLLFAINGLNVVNNYVGRDFMTAIAQRNKAEFIRQALFYIGVFGVSTLVSVIYRFTEERLGLLWREFITRRSIMMYLDQGTFYRLESKGGLANPDQRIAEDVKTFTVTTMSFVLMLLNSTFTMLAFSGVLWSISPVLFGVAVGYAALGSYLTIVLGKPLIRLNYDQLDKEADFRSALIHVRENAESVVLARREGRLKARLLSRLGELLSNMRRITSINRNLGFFTTGYNWMIQIIPALIVAPAFIRGEIEFGVITQSASAFMLLVGAFSLIITQFQSISNFTAVVLRLDSLIEAVEKGPSLADNGIEIINEEGRVAFDHLTLVSPQDGEILIKDLTLSIPKGTRVLISGSNDAGKVALFKATAGLAVSGQGRIIRPTGDALHFMAERPYLPPGTLREVLVRTALDEKISNDSLTDLLKELNLEAIQARANGMDTDQDWETILSLGEQQLLAFIHLFMDSPGFIFLDRPATALRPEQVRKILNLLSKHSITYLAIGKADHEIELYDAVLEINEQGQWAWRQIKDERKIP
ncbi:putative component of ABC transporter [uncultured Desulfobacterium sp.]|uniref:Putative component of ABC transporter n=1 Tax=uncultured Desulfobacterium sp. TaxID=201089 RepID=A0A445N1J1_9BACT|nr:putative component of ABC transporter [uncultured Desulfobacterium sp.]